MNCEQLEPVLASYVTGEATPAERALVEAHLLDCADCRTAFAQAKAGWEAAAGWTVPGPHSALDLDVPLPIDRRPRALRAIQFATAMAAAALLALSLFQATAVTPPVPRQTRQEARPVAGAPSRASVGALYFINPETRQPAGELAIKSLNVGVEILDGVAQTTVEEIFTNNTPSRLEGTFIFPLPPDASITRLAMEIEGNLIEGECLDREKARQTYEGIVRRMKDPALLEWMPGGMFKCRIFPIEPRSDKRIIIGYQQALGSLDGRMKYVYPLVGEATENRELGSFHVSVGVRCSAPVTVRSPSHELALTKKSEREVTATYGHRDFRAREDVVLDIETESAEFIAAAHRGGEAGYLACFVTPRPDAVELARELTGLVFLIDCSASVSEPEMKVARQVVEKMIGALPEVPVTLMGHNVTVRTHEGRAVPTFTTGGACDLGRGLYAAMAAAPDGGEVVYVGEGTPTLGETDVAKIVKSAREACGNRLVTFRAVAIGSGADRATLGAIATAFNGGMHTINQSDDVTRRVDEIARTLGRPAMTDVKVTFEGDVTDVAPAAMGSLYFGERAIVTARYTGASAKAVLIGRVQGREIRREFPLALPASEKGNLYAKRLWAQRRVADLLARGEGSRAEVTALGVSHQLMTPYTSFLVLENEKAYQEHQISRTNKEQEELVETQRPPADHNESASPEAAPTGVFDTLGIGQGPFETMTFSATDDWGVAGKEFLTYMPGDVTRLATADEAFRYRSVFGRTMTAGPAEEPAIFFPEAETDLDSRRVFAAGRRLRVATRDRLGPASKPSLRYPGVVATTVSVDGELVSISIGSNFRVQAGQEFSIWRDGTFVAKIRIERVEANSSVGRIVRKVADPRAGDYASFWQPGDAPPTDLELIDMKAASTLRKLMGAKP